MAIQFEAVLYVPQTDDQDADWTFLRLPQDASDLLPSRGMVSVDGTFNHVPFSATLEPDGIGGHWLRVKSDLRTKANANVGESIQLSIEPVKVEPEPEVPLAIRQAIDSASPKARETWDSITALARRDWIFWIVSAKKVETREKRLEVALSKLSAGSRRPCCFDRSGIVSKSLSCPVPALHPPPPSSRKRKEGES
jgi:hypothetical protein